jgi:hypothetical protein
LESLESRVVPARYVFTGASNASPEDVADWNTLTNWLVGEVRPTEAPGDDDIVILGTLASQRLAVGGNARTIKGLEITGEFTKRLLLDSPLSVKESGFIQAITPVPSAGKMANPVIYGDTDLIISSGATMEWKSGTISGLANIVVSAGAVLNIPSSSIETQDARLVGRTLKVNGAEGSFGKGIVNFTSGRIYFDTIETNEDFLLEYHPARIVNNGIFNVSDKAASFLSSDARGQFFASAGSTFNVDLADSKNSFDANVYFHNLGDASAPTVVVTKGRLGLSAGGESQGQWHAVAGQGIDFRAGVNIANAPMPYYGGTFTWKDGTKFTGNGFATILGGDVTIANNATVVSDAGFVFQGGTLRGGANSKLQLEQVSGWYSGTTAGTGTITIAAGKDFLIGQHPALVAKPTLLDWTIQNSGNIKIGANSIGLTKVDFRMGGGSIIENMAGNAIISVVDESNILKAPGALQLGLIDYRNGKMVKESNSGHSVFQVKMQSKGAGILQTEASSFDHQDINGTSLHIIESPTGRKMSFLGPMDFDAPNFGVYAGTSLLGSGELATTKASGFTNGGIVTPGDETDPIGTFTFHGNYTQTAGGTLALDIPYIGDHDRISVANSTAPVILGGWLDLNVSLGYTAVGSKYTLVDNQNTGPILGRFANWANLETRDIDDIDYMVTYEGGDGNDVVLESLGEVWDVLQTPAGSTLTYLWNSSGYSFTAVMTEGPKHGTLVESDAQGIGFGRFDYTSDPGYTGFDLAKFDVYLNGGYSGSYAFSFQALPGIPNVSGVYLQAGAIEPNPEYTQSWVIGLIVTFDTAVTVAAGAFTLTNGTHTISNPGAVTVAGDGTSFLVLTFTGTSGVDYGSLADGDWTLTILAAGVENALGVAMAEDHVRTDIRRLFGDLNGDGTVNHLDEDDFYLSVGTSEGEEYFSEQYDFNGNGIIDSTDLAAFELRRV